MSDKANRIKQIFIEEAQDIIEELNTKVFDFEENPQNKPLLNDIFRGIHTLKGSANSVGFTRLGAYVHHFEDVLDYYRSEDINVDGDVIDLFLDAIQVVSQMLTIEINEEAHLPDLYEVTLQKINAITEGNGKGGDAPEAVAEVDLGAEFDNEEPQPQAFCSEGEMLAALDDGEKLFKVTLKLEDDAFVRGLDQANFMNLLQTTGRIVCSQWDMSAVPLLESLDLQSNAIKEVIIYVASREEQSEIDEIFEFAEEEEYTVEAVELQAAPVPVPVETAAPQEEEIVPKAEAAPADEKPAAKPEAKPAEEPAATEAKEEIKVRSFVKIDTEKLDELFDSVGEMVIAQNFLMENDAIKTLHDVELNKTLETLFKITRLIQNRVMGLRMVPIRGTFDKMKRVVRDISRKLDKDVKLVLQGEDTEIDKTMVDKLSDPLIHIVRNAMDHGLEATAQERVDAGKSESGEVTLKAYHKGGNIIIEVSDDGRGMNAKKILAKALENGLVTEAEAETLSDYQIFQYILHPGFSLAAEVTDLSGRGVGMDVVNNFVRNMRGKIEIDSKMGEGSTFKILLPLTLAIIDGMLVKSAGETFIIPTLSIVESFRPLPENIHTAKEEGEYVKLREDVLPIVRLNQVLGLDDERPAASESTLVCVEGQNGQYTVLVDELIGRQQVVVKSVGKALSEVREISGGAVLGNGEIALILNVDELYITG